MEGYPGHLVQQQSVYITHRSPPSRSSPAVAAVLSPVLSPGPPVSSPVSSPPDSVATRRFSNRPHHLFNVFRHRKISQCSPNKDGGRRLYTDLRPHTLPHRSLPSRSSPAVAAVLSPVSFPGPPGPPVSSPVSSPPDSVATRRFSSRPHHLFNVFLKVRHRKISQCSPNKDGRCRFEYTA